MNSEFHPDFCKPLPEIFSPVGDTFDLVEEPAIGKELDPSNHIVSQQAIEENRTIKSGYVDKRFRARNQWKTRWLVLRNHILSVYKDDKEYELQNSIDLYRTSKIEEYNKKKRENVFIIGTPKKKYYFQCKNPQDRKDWIQTLLMARESTPIQNSAVPIPLNNNKEHHKNNSETDNSWVSRHISENSFSSSHSNNIPYHQEPLDLTSDYSDLEFDHSLNHGPQFPSTPPLSSSPPQIQKEFGLNNITKPTDNSIYIQGMLYKHCEGYRSWRKRWFVLRDENLCYYKDEKEYELLGMIPLKDISDISLATTTSKSKVYCFKFKSAKRSYKLATFDLCERDNWVKIMQERLIS